MLFRSVELVNTCCCCDARESAQCVKWRCVGDHATTCNVALTGTVIFAMCDSMAGGNNVTAQYLANVSLGAMTVTKLLSLHVVVRYVRAGSSYIFGKKKTSSSKVNTSAAPTDGSGTANDETTSEKASGNSSATLQ